ncbi:tRNA dihydrouridine(20/20a) synthase DusA [candidate division KSB1 bacterium]|nr:tRNA dihydrouridine(20/20a) synthase DusA [candidate division KSB1 bacterium]
MEFNKKNIDLRSKKWPVSIAPMMQWTDRHFRYFMRQITRKTLLYTEMITTGAVMRGNREKLLGFSEMEKPLVLQIGGDDVKLLTECAKIAEDWGYDEVNINVGCPSDRVQNGNFGACLMAKPELIAAAVEKMRQAVCIPVTVKHRIGIDDLDTYEDLANFVRIVTEGGCDRFMIHARKAILKGLNPKENRSIPPLRHEEVYRLKSEFPNLIIEVNGGVRTLEDISVHLQHVNGVMIGRSAYENPFLFAEVDSRFYGEEVKEISREQVANAMIPYIEEQVQRGIPLKRITRPMLGLFAHIPYARLWRRFISENAYKSGAGSEVLKIALNEIHIKTIFDQHQNIPA